MYQINLQTSESTVEQNRPVLLYEKESIKYHFSLSNENAEDTID